MEFRAVNWFHLTGTITRFFLPSIVRVIFDLVWFMVLLIIENYKGEG